MNAPSDSELDVLKVLWDAQQLSAREVHLRLGEEKDWSYSTTRTVLSRMVEKGLVERHSVHGLKVFAASNKKVDVLGRMIRNFSTRVLGMGGSLPASAFADSTLLDEAELEELERLLRSEDDQ